MATLPVFALLFVPIWLGRHELYPWTDAAEVAKNPVLQRKRPYLNEAFFLLRAIFYFAVVVGARALVPAPVAAAGRDR